MSWLCANVHMSKGREEGREVRREGERVEGGREGVPNDWHTGDPAPLHAMPSACRPVINRLKEDD